MGKLRSNRVERTPQTGLTSDRYNYLGLSQAEPNLGDPTVGPSSIGVNPIPVGQVYQAVSVDTNPGGRYWSPLVGFGTTVGVISVYENGFLPGGDNKFQTIHGLNFVGTGVTVETPPVDGPFVGVGIATIRLQVNEIKNQGDIGQVLYNTSSGFAYGASGLVYSSGNVGIGSTLPSSKLDVIGDVNINGKLNVSGVSTLGFITGTDAYFTGVVTASKFSGTFLGNIDTATTATNVIGGIGSITSLSVSGISTLGFITGTDATFSGIVTSNRFVGGVSSFTGLNVSGVSTLGFITGTNAYFTGIVTASQLVSLSSVVGYAITASNIVGGIASVSSLTVSGVSTLGFITGTNAYFTGVVTASNFVGNLTGTASSSLISAYSSNAGFATASATSGTATTATNIIGGIASVSSLTVSGVSTLGFITGTDAYFTGVVTASKFSGTFLGNIDTATTATNVIGGIGSITSLSVSGITTLGTVQISSGVVTATSGIVTYYGKFIGDGTGITNISANLSISTNTTNSNQLIPYATGFGSTTGVGATNSFVFNPSSGNLGIGTTNPKSKLYVGGDGYFTGVVTASKFIGDGSGLTNLSSGSGGTISISTNTTNANQVIPYSVGFGSTAILGATNSFVFNPSSGNLGIGTTNPNYKLQVGGCIGFNDNNIRLCAVDSGSGSANFFAGSCAGAANTSGKNNFFFGGCSGWKNTSGSNNIFLGGYHTGRENTSGSGNIVLGAGSGIANTTGNFNVIIGSSAGLSNVASCNIFIGVLAGCTNTTGTGNVFVGAVSGNNTTGVRNSFFGGGSGQLNTIGYENSFFGSGSGAFNCSGSYNSFFGSAAGKWNSTGCWNGFFGYYSGNCVNGNKNIYIGSRSGWCVTSTVNNKIIIGTGNDGLSFFDSPDPLKSCQLAIGLRDVQYDYGPAKYWIVGDENFNIGIGTTNPKTKLQVGGVLGFNDTNIKIGVNTDANGVGISTGTNNFYVGTKAGCSNVNGKGNVFIGVSAGSSVAGQVNLSGGCCLYSGSNNVMIGECAGMYIVDSCDNNFMGRLAGMGPAGGVGAGQTWGSRNNFFGLAAGCSNTTGGCNNFFGTLAGAANTSGCYNNFFGSFAGRYNTTGISNNFFGASAGRYNTTGCFNNFFGSFYGPAGTFTVIGAGNLNTTGSYNNFFGVCSGVFNTTGSRNNFFGTRSGTFNSVGDDNIFMGNCSGYGNTSGACNIYLGVQAGFGTTTLGTGSQNIFIGYRAGYGVSTGSNMIAIGQNSGNDGVLNISTGSTISNAIVLGNNSHTNAFIKVNWTVTSDERDKANIVSLPLGLDFIEKLNPVQYNWKDREDGKIMDAVPRYGFLAQDIQKIEGEPKVIVDENDPENLKLRESMIIPVLVNAVKELSAELKELKARLGINS